VALPPSFLISSSSSSRPPCVRATATICAPAFASAPRGGIADAARGAGDESDTGGRGVLSLKQLYPRSFLAHAGTHTP